MAMSSADCMSVMLQCAALGHDVACPSPVSAFDDDLGEIAGRAEEGARTLEKAEARRTDFLIFDTDHGGIEESIDRRCNGLKADDNLVAIRIGHRFKQRLLYLVKLLSEGFAFLGIQPYDFAHGDALLLRSGDDVGGPGGRLDKCVVLGK